MLRGDDQSGENIWGGNGGSYWDDGKYGGVRKITVVHGLCIYSIRVVYDENGANVEKDAHGGGEGNRNVEISFELDYPREFLKGVSGHYGPVIQGGSPVIRSLTFQTNKDTYGPYGKEIGTAFSFPAGRAKILGFKGRSDRYLNAIGIHLSTQ